MPHINHIGMHDASRDDSCNICFGCCLWPIFYARTDLVRKNSLSPFPLIDMSHINHIVVHETSRDDIYNACFGCCLWPTCTFYTWVTWLGRMVKLHSRFLTCPTSSILVCMMHIGMTTAKHASDAVCDLHFMHEWLTCSSSTILVCIMHLGMTTVRHASDAVCDLHFTHKWLD